MKRKVVGATPAERRHGIGFQVAEPPPGWHADPWASRASECRRGAAAMRSQSFERRTFASDWIATQIHPARVQAIGQTPVKPGDRDYVAAWWEEREQGCPAWKEDA